MSINSDIQRVDRRRFLAMLGTAGAFGAVGCSTTPGLSMTTSPPDQQVQTIEERIRPTYDQERTLVVIELQGGNDGLASLQPFGDNRLRGVRPDLMSADEELVDAGEGFGWHPNLSGMAELGLAGLVGVGSMDPDFSHFEMEQRWWRGDSSPLSRSSTGFFGRLCDQLDAGAPVTGLSLSGGATPALLADRAVTVGLTDPGSNWFFRSEDPWIDTYRDTVESMATASASDTATMAAARSGLSDMTAFANSIAQVEQGSDERYPWTDLGQQLRFASEVMSIEAGVRILHVRLGGFDTHIGQQWRHAELMNELSEAVTVFTQDLQEQGRLDSTLIATTSEFGRRVEQNDGGTDHGGASTMMLCHPGASGVHGVAPNLGALDDGNVVATARFEDYYATIAEDWFGVPASEVLSSGGDRVPGLISA